MNTIEELEAENSALKAQLATDLKWSKEDEPLPEDAQIHAAHPQNKDEATPSDWARWQEALRLVSKKRSKYALVDLVNWALTQRDDARQQLKRSCDDEHRLTQDVTKLTVQRDELLAALEALSNCYCGSLYGVGGGTRIAPSMTVGLFKNARAAIANVKGTKP
jgi:hypothetical protein